MNIHVTGGASEVNGQSSRGRLALVPKTEFDFEGAPRVQFCGHCGARPKPDWHSDNASRVCEACHLGLVLEASEDSAPQAGAAFLVLDGSMSVCAVSAQAERLLGARETEAVNRHVTEFVVPADAEAQGPENLAVAVMWAARGDETVRSVTVRPTNVFGVRLRARIGRCGPRSAALLVFDRP